MQYEFGLLQVLARGLGEAAMSRRGDKSVRCSECGCRLSDVVQAHLVNPPDERGLRNVPLFLRDACDWATREQAETWGKTCDPHAV